jgi:D-beta-D-heptose 7-phosphate kinase/D-beta-D-heptose 1-phosphate adenosyltransferase
MTNGCFDVLHAGHVRYLQAARALGDCLLVAVNDDASVAGLKGRNRPLNPVGERMQVLAALGCVDYVVPFAQDTPEALIACVLPDKLVKGGDYRPEQVAGHECVTRAGGEVIILDYHDGFSTTALIEAARRLPLDSERNT